MAFISFRGSILIMIISNLNNSRDISDSISGNKIEISDCRRLLGNIGLQLCGVTMLLQTTVRESGYLCLLFKLPLKQVRAMLAQNKHKSGCFAGDLEHLAPIWYH